MKKHLFVFLIVSMLAPVPFVMAKTPGAFSFKPSIIRVQNAIKGEATEWTLSNVNIQKKLTEARTLLKDTQLRVGTEKISYTEKRVMSEKGEVSVGLQNFKDIEREIALVLLNEKTGKLEAIKVVKYGGQLISPPGYQIKIIERMNGIKWNHWATQYKVESPKNAVVLLNKYPVEKTGGGVEYFMYSPYSDELDNPEIIKAGAEYLDNVVNQALNDLRTKKVMSKAVPGKLVADVLPADYYKHLPFLEQSDLLEAIADSDWTTKRILGTLGYNQGKAWTLSSNYAGANGWVQFTDNWKGSRPGTYSTIARMYPDAKLDKNFRAGAADHLNSMKAAVLLYDSNLQLLINKFGSDMVRNPLLEEYLAASYNGPPSKVIKSLTASGITGSASKSNWFEGLFEETHGYIAKLRLLNSNNIPQKFLD